MPSVLDRLRTVVANVLAWSSTVLSNNSVVVAEVKSDATSDSDIKQKGRKIILHKSSTSLQLNGTDLGNLTEEDIVAILDCHPNCKAVLTVTVRHILTLTAIPTSIGKFENMTSLNLSSNGLKDLPWSIMYLRKLENLNLSNNKFTFLPPLIGHLPVLEKMNLAHNCLFSLPTSLINLKKLRVLNVEGNDNLHSPPLEVCRTNVDAVIAHLQKRLGRTNLWHNTTGKYSTEMPQSLLEVCVATVLGFQIDYFSMVYVPPSLKRHLYNRFEANRNAVKVAKCSRCGKFFSNETYFDSHVCV